MKLYRQLPVQTYRISDKAEAAHRRGDQFEKRHKLIETWEAFCEPSKKGYAVTFNVSL